MNSLPVVENPIRRLSANLMEKIVMPSSLNSTCKSNYE